MFVSFVALSRFLRIHTKWFVGFTSEATYRAIGVDLVNFGQAKVNQWNCYFYNYLNTVVVVYINIPTF